MNPTVMRMIFSLMDADGDGKLTLQEWQAAHERIFKAMDTDHDGTVTIEETLADCSRENPLLRPDKRAEVCLLRCLHQIDN